MNVRPVLLALLIGGLTLSQASLARDKDRGGGLFGLDGRPPDSLIDRRSVAQPRMSPGDAARAAQERNGGGKVLSVDPAAGGYRVKLLRQGDVRVLFIPDER